MEKTFFEKSFLYLLERFDAVKVFIMTMGERDPVENIEIIFVEAAWPFVIVLLVFLLFPVYMDIIQNRYAGKIKWSLLAINVPKENLQSVRAAENIFAALWPFYESVNVVEKYIEGKHQQAFSLEIVSIGGYTQFLIRTPSVHKEMVEAAIYAQYSKAEIIEVEDYVKRFKDVKFPDEKWDMFGSEFTFTKPSPFPIRTYPAFEHSLTQTFADPMASLLEVFNHMKKGEELWMQIIITPITDEWKKEGYNIINKIIGAKSDKKKGILETMLSPVYASFTLIQELFNYGLGYEAPEVGGKGAADARSEPPNKMLYLTPEEKNMIEGITLKISKIAYQTKLRFVYLAPKGQMNKPKGVGAFIGALQQFSTIDLNQFKPSMKTMTKANYFFVRRRVIMKQNRLMRAYRGRSQSRGAGIGFILNIEELASVFHFPIPEAIRESVRIVDAKKESAPVELPDEIFQGGEDERHAQYLIDDKILNEKKGMEDNNISVDKISVSEETKAAPPTNLPI